MEHHPGCRERGNGRAEIESTTEVVKEWWRETRLRRVER
jgi:hypothetical protein